jgi:hypothetical protein
MKNSSESTFGKKLNNAETLLSHLKSFTNFKPLNAQDNIKLLEEHINNIRVVYNLETNDKQVYTLAVDVRQKLLTTDEFSLKKIVTPINAYIKAMYGKASKEASSMNEQISKIRGGKHTKNKDSETTKNVSSSQQSYASLTQHFENLITTLQVLKPEYAPTNENITVEKLKENLQKIQESTSQINTITVSLSKNRDERKTKYEILRESALRIKEAVKSQYGNNSTEYHLIKGLKF